MEPSSGPPRPLGLELPPADLPCPFSARDTTVALDVEPPGPAPGHFIGPDADAGAGRYFPIGNGPSLLDEKDPVGAQIRAVQGPVNGQGCAQFARPIGQLTVGAAGAVAAHPFQTLQGFQRSDEDSGGEAFLFRDDVEAVVHAVDKVDVGVAGWAVHDLGARGAAP